MEIGKIISQLRNDKGLNQRELAIHLGVSNGAIGMWETGKRQPDLETIKKIASFFNVSVDYLLATLRIQRQHLLKHPVTAAKIPLTIGLQKPVLEITKLQSNLAFLKIYLLTTYS